jgi:hypothetical protein
MILQGGAYIPDKGTLCSVQKQQNHLSYLRSTRLRAKLKLKNTAWLLTLTFGGFGFRGACGSNQGWYQDKMKEGNKSSEEMEINCKTENLRNPVK